MSTEERIIEVMGTTAHLVITDGNATLAERAVERLHELEARWSRFRSDSEISRLNARPGIPVVVSAETYTLVERAVEGAAMTGGLFDPTLLPELRDAGYDRSFELIGVAGAAGDAARQRPPTMRRSDSTRAAGRAVVQRDPARPHRPQRAASSPASKSTQAESAKASPPTWWSTSCSEVVPQEHS